MKIATIRTNRGTQAAVESADGWAALPFGDAAELLRSQDWRKTAEQAISSPEALVPAEVVELASAVTSPRKVICCGLNYGDHIAEMGRDLPEHPTLFAKYADTLTGPHDDISVAGSRAVDWEAELAVIIGKGISGVDAHTAADSIAGYAVSNDISMRDWQKRTLQWFQGKNFTATTPLGPWMVTADEFPDTPVFTVEGWINDERVQHGDTSTLVFPPAELVAYISRFTSLSPGDVVLTGTPGGVGSGMSPQRFLRSGDVVRTTITSLGELKNVVTINDD